MVRQNVIGTPEDEVIAMLVHLLLALMCQLHLLVTCTRFPACQDGPVIVPSEVRWALKHLRIAEACHGIELQAQCTIMTVIVTVYIVSMTCICSQSGEHGLGLQVGLHSSEGYKHFQCGPKHCCEAGQHRRLPHPSCSGQGCLTVECVACI